MALSGIDSPLGVYFVVGFFALAKDADGIVGSATAAGIGAVTLAVRQRRRAQAAGIAHTLDFFSLQRSQALQTLLRTLESLGASEGEDWRAVISE
jgi:glycerate-2-kinase